MPEQARVLVVGAGHNGLVCAVHLAQAGVDVTVLEHAPHPGGATSTVETVLPGYRFDHCAGFNPMTMASPAFEELRLEDDGLEWVTPQVAMAHPFDDGTAIALHRDVGATAASLDATTPGAGAAWSELVQRTLPHADRLARSILDPLPPVLGPLRMAAAWRRYGVELVRRGIGSAAAFGLDVFDGSTRPTAWLASSAQHSGLPPDAAGSGLFGFLLQLLGHAHGWPFPRGGMGRIADLLVARLERAGGRVRCEAHVDAILVRGGRVGGARLASGEELGADVVVSTVSAGVLARMLPDDALPAPIMRRLQRWRYGTGVFRIDYALDMPVPWEAPEAREAGVVQVGGELRELAKAAQEGTRGDVPEQPALIIGQHSLFDRTRAPGDGHTLWVYSHVPPSYELGDDEVAGRIEAQIDRFAPTWRTYVLGRHVRPPLQTERENPSLVGGDLAGGVYELDQLLVFRPTPELCRGRTPLRGLYVAGASVHPGGAVQGMSGRRAAHAVLADRAPLRLGRLGPSRG